MSGFDMTEFKQKNLTHRASRSGPKADRKKERDKTKRGVGGKEKGQNPKAFTVKSRVRAARNVQRTLDREHKKEHVAQVKKTPEYDPPPIVVVIVGPKGCGKSTLMRSLIKNYTKHTVGEIQGPITVVTSKVRRITFFECPSDLNAMIDLGKIADLVLLMIDAKVGFQMETFEFLNILQVHGMPKVLGILTHLDHFKDGKKLGNTKKRLKKRFWTDIYDGAKLFYLSGVINGKYPKTEIHNLTLHLSRIKFRPLVWRNTHSYVLADRYEDITPPDDVHQDPHCDRTVLLYGYSRGMNLKGGSKVHIAGAGDFFIQDAAALDDPCPSPSFQAMEDARKAAEAAAQDDPSGNTELADPKLAVMRRKVSSKETLLYAPMSDVGNVMFDKDAMYIRVDSKKADEEAEGIGMVRTLQDVDKMEGGGLEELEETTMSLFAGSKPLTAADVAAQPPTRDEDRSTAVLATDSSSSSDSSSDSSSESESGSGSESGSDSESDSGGNEGPAESGTQWKDDMKGKAARAYAQRSSEAANLMSLVYGESDEGSSSDTDASDDSDGDFFTVRKSTSTTAAEEASDEDEGGLMKELELEGDCSKFMVQKKGIQDWKSMEILESIRDRFVTGNWKNKQDGEAVAEGGNADPDDGFEDLETGEVFAGDGTLTRRKGTDHDGSNEDDSDSGSDDDKEDPLKQGNGSKHAVKPHMRRNGNNEPDSEDDTPEQAEARAKKIAHDKLNLSEFNKESDLKHTGIPAGRYVRVEIGGIPAEFVQNFNAADPVVIGGLLPQEISMGFMRVRVKKHRWYKRLLKSNDPLIYSVGWRRFQSIPIYAMEDVNGRHRMLKYTPEHMHCLSNFYAPNMPPNTGFLAFQSMSTEDKGFRVAATGTVLELDQSFQIVKKLKLTGTPHKIHKNTAFIRGMFSSELEVSKFIGASLKTVSGIRGQVKKPTRGGTGTFRATFEDKILMSDIIFLRTWAQVAIKQFYNPVHSRLAPPGEQWQGMRTIGKLRHDLKVKAPLKKDSLYKPIEREARKFNPLKIPSKLQAALPFKSKPKEEKKRSNSQRGLYMTKRAVAMEPKERKMYTMMQQVRTVRNEKTAKRKELEKVRSERKRKERDLTTRIFESTEKEKRRKKYALAGAEHAKKKGGRWDKK